MSMQSDDRWRLALEAAGDAVWDWNLQDDSVYRSPRWGEMLGYAPAETAELNWSAMLHPADRAEALRRLEACLHGATPAYEAEYRLRCKSGQYRWISARGKVVERDANGAPLRFVGSQRDVTNARVRIESLQDSERLWQFALEGHGDALWDWSLENGEITVSPSFRAIIGWHDDCPLRGNDIWPERLHPDDLRKAMAAFNAHLVGDRPIAEVEFRLRVEDATYRWVALRGKIMERDASGKPLRLIGTVRDVHDRHLIVEREKRQALEAEIKASQDFRAKLTELLGGKPEQQDPAELARQAIAERDEARRLNAVYQAAPAGTDVAALLDSVSFRAGLAEAKDIAAYVAQVVKENPRYTISAGAHNLNQGNGASMPKPKSIDDLIRGR